MVVEAVVGGVQALIIRHTTRLTHTTSGEQAALNLPIDNTIEKRSIHTQISQSTITRSYALLVVVLPTH
jgi:hypothetical protein